MTRFQSNAVTSSSTLLLLSTLDGNYWPILVLTALPWILSPSVHSCLILSGGSDVP